MQLSNNKVLITGGASGIGLGLTERFIKEGNTVIIVGRRESALQEAAEKLPSVITKVCDLAEEADRVALYNWLAENHSDVSVLVNNAGIQNWMGIDSPDFYEKAKAEVTTNVLAPVHLTSLFIQLPALKAIMNVTSGLAFVQFSKVPVYCATKAFLHSFTMSARYLLKAKDIEVIDIIPPALNTDLGGKGLHDGQPPVSKFVDAIFEQLAEGKTELSFGFAEAMTKAGPEEIKAAFNRLNP